MKLPRFLANIIRKGEEPEIVTTRNFDDLGAILGKAFAILEDTIEAIKESILSKAEIWGMIRRQIGVYNVKDYGAKGDGVTNDYTALAAADAAAYAAGGTVIYPPGTYITGSNITRLADTLHMKGAILKGAYTLTQTGTFQAGRYQAFDSTLTVSFGAAAVEWILPQWMKQSTDTDDTNSLLWAFGLPNNQYDIPGVSLGGMVYYYTQTLIITKQVHSTGAVLIPGGTGNMFKRANNAAIEAALQNAGVDCTILIMDGGSLSDCTVFVVDPDFDVTGNSSIWLVNCQENYGKKPLHNVLVQGYNTKRFLGLVTSRFNTTSTFADFGGIYGSTGFRADSNNNCHYSAIYMQNLKNVSGVRAFDFYSIGEFTVDNCWSEQGGNLVRGFYFDSCGQGSINALKLGEAPSGDDFLDGVYVSGCSDLDFRNLSINGITFAHAAAYVTNVSSRVGMDSSYEAKTDTYGQLYLIENNNLVKGRIPAAYGVNLADTSGKEYVSYMPFGTKLSVTVGSKSGAMSGVAFDVWRLSGGTYSNRGTLTFGTLSNAGDRATQTINLDTSANYYLVPSGGSGIVDVEWEFNLVNGSAFI